MLCCVFWSQVEYGIVYFISFKTHKLIFSGKAFSGRLGAGGFAGGRFKNSVKNWFLTKQIFLIQLFFSAFKSPNGLPISKQNELQEEDTLKICISKSKINRPKISFSFF